MRPDLVIMLPPAFDDDPCFRQRVENFAVEQFVAKLRVEAFAIAILPGASWLDVSGLRSHRGDPILHGGRYKFGSIIGTDITRNAA